MSLKNEFKEFLKSNNLKQSHVARSLGVSASLISQWIKGSYAGDIATLEEKIKQFMQNFN